MKDNLSVAIHALSMHVLTSFSVDKILLPMYMNWSTDFSGLPFASFVILLVSNRFLSLDQLMFVILDLGSLGIEMTPMYLLARLSNNNIKIVGRGMDMPSQ